MADKRFDEFVQRENQEALVLDQEPIDWQAEKGEYLRHVEGLFSKISEFLKPYVVHGQVKIAYQPIALNEEHIGPYSAKEMLITIGSKIIKLEPIGANILLSKGRVDVVGPLFRAQLLLLNSNIRTNLQRILAPGSINGGRLSELQPETSPKIEWTWKIATRPPNRAFADLSKENFLDLLLEVSNG